MAIGTFWALTANDLGSFGTLWLALVATAFAYYDWRIRNRQLREREARAEAAINAEVAVEVLPSHHCDAQGRPLWILQTKVTVRNSGYEAWCIPAVYVSARALLDPQRSSDYGTGFYESDPDALPGCGPLSEPRNIARIPESIYQVSPEEVETFIRWDTLDAAFIRQHPVIVIQVEVFSASFSLLGFREGFYGSQRDAWLRLMNGSDHASLERHREVIFARAPQNDGKIKRGKRIIRQPGTGLVDVESSLRFKEVLSGMMQWSRYQTIDLWQLTGIEQEERRGAATR